MSTPQDPGRARRPAARAGEAHARTPSARSPRPPRPPRPPSRRVRRRRRATLTAAGALLVVLIVAVIETSSPAGGHAAHARRPGSSAKSDPAGGGGSRSVASSSVKASDASAGSRRSAGRHARRRHHHRPSPGSLPQTSALPSSHTAGFRREMSSLWRAIVTGSPRLGRRAFFPEGAYLQLKQIEDPAADFTDRLLHDYALDIGAAHRLLGRGAGKAVLLGVRVPAGYAHWVPPGVCYNSIGYYETPNSRLLYREYGKVHSFGIASMISWRGVWYVVHLGAILRSAEEGIVESPAEGPGVSEPSSTC